MKKFIRLLFSHSFFADRILKIARYIISNNWLLQDIQDLFIRIRHYFPQKRITTKIRFRTGIEAIFELNLQSYVDNAIFYGIYEPATLDFYQKILPQYRAVWDIGSYIGFYVVIAGIILRGKGTIFAFEPVPVNFRALQKNLELNRLTNVHLFNVALSSQDGEDEIYLLDINRPTSSPTLNQKWAASSKLPKHIKVKTRSTMSLLSNGEIRRPDIIKIDAEMSESIILKDLKPLLRENEAPDIITEIMPPSIEPLKRILIEECNYECYHINASGPTKVEELKMRRPYNDYFFTKKPIS